MKSNLAYKENSLIKLEFGHKQIVKSRKQRNITAESPLQTTSNKKEPVAPIKDKNHIAMLKAILKKTGKYAIRNWCLFVLGINIGLRCSDIVRFRFCDVLDAAGRIVKDLTVYEQKTGKQRYTPLNSEARNALKEYIATFNGQYNMEDYLFPSNKKSSPHLTVGSVRDILKDAAAELRQKLEQKCNDTDDVKKLANIGSHSMRKTFAYHFFMKHKNNQYHLSALQEMLNHASLRDTLRYIGLDRELKATLVEGLLL